MKLQCTRNLGTVCTAMVFLGAAFFPGLATAQNTSGFAVNRFDPAERGSDWFWAESLDLRGHNRWAVGVVGDWAYKPLVVYNQDGGETSALVKHQLHGHLGASVVLVDSVRLAASLPLLAYQAGEDAGVGGVAYEAPSGTALGDLRIGTDLRLAGEYGGPATLAFGVQVHLPTGSQKSYTGDGATRLVPHLAVAGDVGLFTYAVKTGVNFRFEGESFAGADFGHEWALGGAAGLRLLDKKLTIGPELWASTVIEDGSSGFFDEASTPFEGVIGAHYKTESGWRLGVGMGPGLTAGLGSPKVRTLVSVEWFPNPEEKPAIVIIDTDGDGIVDEQDACPKKPGPESSDREKHGCPLPDDTDSDGILDAVDACPTEAGVASDDSAKHGCPVRDRDQDGILDPEDACVDEPGVPNVDSTKNGCPPPLDTDGDGILDEDDACVDQAGPANADKAQHGCPRAQVVDGQVKILDRIEFATSSDRIGEVSTPILNAVLKVFLEHPEITKVRIEGHTDNRGGAWMNKDLSRRRAQSVKQWLLDKGIEAERLTSIGVGPERPLDTNQTAEGRQNNRRVEFHILEETTKQESAR